MLEVPILDNSTPVKSNTPYHKQTNNALRNPTEHAPQQHGYPKISPNFNRKLGKLGIGARVANAQAFTPNTGDMRKNDTQAVS